jgi:hypothetical protein
MDRASATCPAPIAGADGSPYCLESLSQSPPASGAADLSAVRHAPGEGAHDTVAVEASRLDPAAKHSRPSRDEDFAALLEPVEALQARIPIRLNQRPGQVPADRLPLVKSLDAVLIVRLLNSRSTVRNGWRD